MYILFNVGALKNDKYNQFIICLLISGTLTMITYMITGAGTFSMQRDILLIVSVIPVFIFLRLRKVSSNEIISAFTAYLVLTLIIQIYQQIFISNPLFGLLYTTEGNVMSAERNDLYRFRIGIATLGEFCLCYYWSRICEKINAWAIVFFVASSVSVYLYLTRQYMVASLLTIFLSIFFIKDERVKRYSFFFIIVFSIILALNYNLFFKNLVEFTGTETYSTDIREVAYGFFFSHVFDNPIAWFTGHGHTFDEIRWTRRGLYASDIGFVGQMYLQGVMWVLIYFYTLYKVLWRGRKRYPLYIKLFMFCTLIHSPMVFPYSALSTMYIWMIFLYLCSIEDRFLIYERRSKV